MEKPPKVVPLQEQQYRLIAEDQKAHRIIFGIGSERMAIDLFSRITKLPPATGDRPAEVLPMKKIRRKRKQPEGPARAETPTHYITLGFDEDLKTATEIALRTMIDFLVTKKHLSRDDAYALKCGRRSGYH